MTKLNGWVVLGILVGVSGLAACNDMGAPNDLVGIQREQRESRRIPGPTELPPGLGEDLPATPTPVQPPKVTVNDGGGT